MRPFSLLAASSLALLAAFTPAVPAFAADAPKATDFIRVDEDDKAARLQTAVTRFEKDGRTVELVGAIHIADAAYYKQLNERLAGYDAVLFEMVGGEKIKETGAPTKDDGDGENLDALRKIYSMAARFLGLTGQVESIDYKKDNFVHADLTLEEFRKLQSEKGESILSFAQKAQESGAKEPDAQKLLQAMLSGNSNLMKLEIVHTLGGGDDQIATFVGADNVIIGDRNTKCLQVLDSQIEGGRKNVAIFYGAAHFPDMEKQLAAKGFHKVRQDWLTAWDIPKPQAKPAPAAAPAVEPLKKAS